jgi:hypothetical protein
MTDYTVWHGTREDLEQLQKAVEHHCECKPAVIGYMGQGRPGTMCAAHKLLLDQKVMDHLDFVARNRARFVEAEPDAG